jgi:hypothetical protein
LAAIGYNQLQSRFLMELTDPIIGCPVKWADILGFGGGF